MHDYALTFLNRESGELCSVLSSRARLARLRKRLRVWSSLLPLSKVDLIGVTLTYSPEHSWSPRHISRFMDVVRRKLGGRLLGYAWVAEMQRRGAVHYHVILVVKRGVRIPKPDLSGWWVYGSTNVMLLRSLGSYLTSYIRKLEQKSNFPKGIRIFSVVISKNFYDGEGKFLLRLFSVPAWLIRKLEDMGMLFYVISNLMCPFRVRGGGWMLGGMFFVSEWSLVGIDRVPAGGS